MGQCFINNGKDRRETLSAAELRTAWRTELSSHDRMPIPVRAPSSDMSNVESISLVLLVLMVHVASRIRQITKTHVIWAFFSNIFHNLQFLSKKKFLKRGSALPPFVAKQNTTKGLMPYLEMVHMAQTLLPFIIQPIPGRLRWNITKRNERRTHIN